MTEEIVSVEELYLEELDALVEQHRLLTEQGGSANNRIAESLLHVIAYFRVRLGLEEDGDMESIYGVSTDDRTIH